VNHASGEIDDVRAGVDGELVLARAAELRGHAHQARRTLAEIEALPATEAAQLIRDRTAYAAVDRTAKAVSRARAAEPRTWHLAFPGYQSSAVREFGPSR
jgi:hypothetical protein